MLPGLLVEVTRRNVRSGDQIVESRHHGHLVVLGPDGEIAASIGDPYRRTFLRSAVKPFQATVSLELAGAAASDLTQEQLAVGWASHRGEPRHLEAVRGLCAAAGIQPEQLTTPAAVPEAQPDLTPQALHYNCSGKHALFALAGRALGLGGPQLIDPEGPLQRRVLATLEDVLGPISAVGVDGCGAPAVQAPLVGLAAGFRRLRLERRWDRVVAAGLEAPGLVGGEGRLDSALLDAGVLAKVGAEGVFGVSWRDGADIWGAAIKAEDGNVRGAAPALHGLLVELGVAPEDSWRPAPVLGGGRPQGVARASAEVHRLAGHLGRVGRSSGVPRA